ncbi:aminotransferase class-V family protein [Mycobacterium ulcerans str. Harvey]|uniref:Aminotransferase class-V family protein n=1 Tax=Mycobacterium ulcerans str. Harvey TaxID=1299332 RepID=A0ABP3A7J9_MYCUL|nr:aminotransferase class-V family protein [Mycobacterium ulcerans str. Harvey]
MAYDVARVRGLHPSLGDGWVHFDAPAGMLIPDSVATTVSTAFRRSAASTAGAHPSARRSAAVLQTAREAVADLVNADPAGVVLGADRAVLLSALAEASSSRAGLGYEVIVSRLDDEANIAPGCAPPTATGPR